MLHLTPFRPMALLLLPLVLALAACNKDSDPADGNHFIVGTHAERGVEVLNPSRTDLPFYHSFGNVTYGQQFTHTFQLRNVEDRAITILRTEPACTCSRVKSIEAWKGDSPESGTIPGDLSSQDNILRVEPGQAFGIEILVDTLRVNPNAAKLVVLRVYTDSKVDPFLTFELHFRPEKLFEMASPSLQLGDIPLGGGVGSTLQIYSRAALDQPRLIDVFSTSEGLQAELVLISGYESNWNLNVTTVGQETLGPLRGKVILRTTNGLGQGDAGRFEVPVEGRVVPAVMMYPGHLSFGQVELGKSSTLHAGVQGLAPGHRIKISDYHLDGPYAPHLAVELEPINEDTFGRSIRVDVHITCKESAPAGAIDATLTLDLVDEADATIVRPIQGLIQ